MGHGHVETHQRTLGEQADRNVDTDLLPVHWEVRVGRSWCRGRRAAPVRLPHTRSLTSCHAYAGGPAASRTRCWREESGSGTRMISSTSHWFSVNAWGETRVRPPARSRTTTAECRDRGPHRGSRYWTHRARSACRPGERHGQPPVRRFRRRRCVHRETTLVRMEVGYRRVRRAGRRPAAAAARAVGGPEGFMQTCRLAGGPVWCGGPRRCRARRAEGGFLPDIIDALA